MTAGFKDHFSGHAADYAEHRPGYPARLVDLLAERTGGHRLALDCGCGSGQLSVLLAGRFDRVVATDASFAQVANAFPHPRVAYAVARAEQSGLPDRSADLVVAAQAAHWFDLPAFWAEVDRVARPGGLVALVGYGRLTVAPDLDPLLVDFHDRALGPFWPAERRLVVEGYAGIGFPYAELPVPPVEMRCDWSLPQLLRYVETWSAVKGAERRLGRSPLADFASRLAPVWGDPAMLRTVSWPLAVRLGRAGGRPS